ncbi:MAG: AAA family ATPase [Lentisphaeraceae bacterium]|nr:AAA family ATPase [Lentisphaeraceae bacterium]
MEEFVPEYEKLRIERFPSPQMLVDKNGCSLNLDQLSDGEKNIIALVGDLARRLALGNPHARNPLTGEGIVLIDEIDLHLHPAWQRLIISKIPEVFPNCQFIISTHSPQIISHVKPEDIILLNRTKKGIIEQVPVIESLGKNTDRILEDIMSVDARPEEYKLQIEKVYDLIQENILDEASNLVNSLRLNIGDDPALIKATILIARKRSIGK